MIVSARAMEFSAAFAVSFQAKFKKNLEKEFFSFRLIEEGVKTEEEEYEKCKNSKPIPGENVFRSRAGCGFLL